MEDESVPKSDKSESVVGGRGRESERERETRTTIAKVTNARNDEGLLVKLLVHLRGDDGDLGPLGCQGLDALRRGNEVKEEDLLFHHAMIEQHLNGLRGTAASG